jgi:hypothetical protein
MVLLRLWKLLMAELSKLPYERIKTAHLCYRKGRKF